MNGEESELFGGYASDGTTTNRSVQSSSPNNQSGLNRRRSMVGRTLSSKKLSFVQSQQYPRVSLFTQKPHLQHTLPIASLLLSFFSLVCLLLPSDVITTCLSFVLDFGLNESNLAFLVIRVGVMLVSAVHFCIRRDTMIILIGVCILLADKTSFSRLLPSLFNLTWLIPTFLCVSVSHQFSFNNATFSVRYIKSIAVAVSTSLFFLFSATMLFVIFYFVILMDKGGSLDDLWLLLTWEKNKYFRSTGFHITFFTCLLVCMILYHGWKKRQTYIPTLTFLIPQIARLWILNITNEKLPHYFPLMLNALDSLSLLFFVIGLCIDMVLHNDATLLKLAESLKECDGLHKKMSLELNVQNEMMKRAYAKGSAIYMEKYDFLQRLANKLSIPMSEVSNSVNQLLSDVSLRGWQAQCVTDIQEAAENLQTLLTDVKYLLAVESGNVGLEEVPFILADIIEECLENMSKNLGSTDVEIFYRIKEGVPHSLIGDPNCLIQILQLLVSNALKFTDRGEVGVYVDVNGDLDENQDQIELIFEIYDTGVGMTDDERELCNLFQPFPNFGAGRRAPVGSVRRRGSGLGLVVCEKLVRLLGGSLTLEINESGGTSSKVTVSLEVNKFPLDESKSPLSNQTNLSIIKNLPVLVVEDNASVRTQLEDILMKLGCHVSRASGGIQIGIRELKIGASIKEPYKVVLVDYHQMGGMDALENIRTLKEDVVYSDLRIVLLLSPLDNPLRKYILKCPDQFLQITCLMKPLKRVHVMAALITALGFEFREEGRASSAVIRSSPLNRNTLARPTLRVLVVDDSSDIQKEVQQIVEGMGHICTGVSDGVAAVAYARKNHFDVILMDIYMPLLDGIAATQLIRTQESETKKRGGSLGFSVSPSPPQTPPIRELKDSLQQKLTPRVPIIGITSTFNEQENIKCINAGMDDYVSKQNLSSFLTIYLGDLEKYSKIEPNGPSTLSDTSSLRGVKVNRSGSTGSTSSQNLSNNNNNNNNVSKTLTNIIKAESNSRRSSDSSTVNDGKLMRRIEDLENFISRFVPKEFQELIAPQGMENVILGDAIFRTITIFFSDIRDFTSLTEKMHVHQVIDFLNTYVAFALPSLTEKGGFIDKFIGDAIMALFPHSDIKEQAISAVSAAVGMMRSLDFMKDSGFEPVETGIGINTGKTIVGIVGTETRMEPTALGDAVNLASRTEALCKQYGARILITGNTKAALGESAEDLFLMRFVDSVTVKGKSEPCEIYEIIDGDREDIQMLKKQLMPIFLQSIQAFQENKHKEALDGFLKCVEIHPLDKPSQLYITRLQALLSKETIVSVEPEPDSNPHIDLTD